MGHCLIVCYTYTPKANDNNFQCDLEFTDFPSATMTNSIHIYACSDSPACLNVSICVTCDLSWLIDCGSGSCFIQAVLKCFIFLLKKY